MNNPKTKLSPSHQTFFTTDISYIPLNDSDDNSSDDYENIFNIIADEAENKENTFPEATGNLEEFFAEYEDNELVHEAYQSLKSFFTTSKCLCRDKKNKQKCFEMVGFHRFFERHLQFRGLSHEQLDYVLIGQLMAFDHEADNKSNEKERRHSLRYCFNSRITLCKNTYLKLVGVGESKLLAILSHFKKTGINSRVHRNTKCIPQRNTKVTINYELAKEVKAFITNYALVNGLPCPGRHLSKTTSALIYLPTSENYTTVFENFQQSIKLAFGDEQKIISRNSFIRLWKALTPHIKFLKPQSDLCAVCEELRYKIAHINDLQKKEDVIKEYNDHLQAARLEREYYQCNITQAQQDTKQVYNKQLIKKSNPSLKSID
ncbi:14518_t:CDS:1, partial [Cetraspora pellucida]